jgi:hypothetical protein
MAVSSIVLISALAVAATLGIAPKAAPTQPVEQVRPATSRVVCGMVVVQVTPSVDPKMVLRSRKIDPKPDYKIRSIQPRICNE